MSRELQFKNQVDSAYELVSSECEQADSLDILRAVEETSSFLNKEARRYNAIANMVTSVAEALSTTETSQKIGDAELWLKAENGLSVWIEKLHEYRNSAVQDPELNGYKEEDVINAFDLMITASENLKEAACTMRWAIMENHANLEKPEGPAFSSSKDFIDSLLH